MASIRWRFQLWYGLILLAVLAGFGFTAYRLMSDGAVRRGDDELRRRANALVNFFHGPPRGPGLNPDMPGRPPPDMPPGEMGPPEEGFNGPPPERMRRDFHLPPRIAGLFDETDPNGFYYVVFQMGDPISELARSSNAPPNVSFVPPARPGPPPFRAVNGRPPPGPPPLPPEPRSRENYRELSISTRPGEVVVIGHSLVPELRELRRVALFLSGVGGLILLVGFAGGWWLAGRAIRPIEDISSTAAKIAAGDLAQRIDVADTDNELGRLAQVLNSTFARLEAAFAQQQQFTSDAAHELRTPLSVMLTQTQAALHRDRSADEYRATVEACERAAQRMRGLIESLLKLARLDAGQEVLRRAPVDLARVAAESVELVQPLAAARRMALDSDLDAAECEGDAERLALVITNLLTNAVHYNHEGGKVRITTKREGDFALLTVIDNGPGIAPEHLPHIFKRFYRADPARTAAKGRTGLGLAISRAIIEAHGGSIEAASTPGEGAVFTVRLPLRV